MDTGVFVLPETALGSYSLAGMCRVSLKEMSGSSCLSPYSKMSKNANFSAAVAYPSGRGQDRDNYVWIRDAESHNPVVGSQARILYADARGRVKIALEFNKMVREGKIGPVMLGRDHHDTGGTDSPFRETANIRDGSNIMSDMTHECWAGNAARGMALCVLSNGGGVGTGKAINGGFELVLDGTPRVDGIIRSALDWDVMGGVARRAWATNEHAMETAASWNEAMGDRGHITLPFLPEDGLIEDLVRKAVEKS